MQGLWKWDMSKRCISYSWVLKNIHNILSNSTRKIDKPDITSGTLGCCATLHAWKTKASHHKSVECPVCIEAVRSSIFQFLINITCKFISRHGCPEAPSKQLRAYWTGLPRGRIFHGKDIEWCRKPPPLLKFKVPVFISVFISVHAFVSIHEKHLCQNSLACPGGSPQD